MHLHCLPVITKRSRYKCEQSFYIKHMINESTSHRYCIVSIALYYCYYIIITHKNIIIMLWCCYHYWAVLCVTDVSLVGLCVKKIIIHSVTVVIICYILSEFLHTVRCQSSPANLQGIHVHPAVLESSWVV